MSHTPLVLAILDGFGHRNQAENNAIALANMPNYQTLWQNSPHCLLNASGTAVGLPDDQMGNSEVGHLNIGAGRIIRQELTRINCDIADGTFYQNVILNRALTDAKESKRQVHVIGLLSPGGVHSDEQHIFALSRMAAQIGVTTLCLHAILDGRDTPPKSAMNSLQQAEALLQSLQVGHIASISGRFYAMDRDKRWERTERYYNLLVAGKAPHAPDAITALEAAYARAETDEFVQPIIISKNATPALVRDGDSIIFMNFRADRARQLTAAFLTPDFVGFARQPLPRLQHFVSLTHYADDLKTEVAYAPQQYADVLGDCLAQHGLKQCRIAETEKYAHVTFFFNGGKETPFTGEDRILIPSPKIATYDLQPSMSALIVTEKLLEAIKSRQYAVIIVNFANPDMVGHTGKLDATISAVETVDHCLGEITAALAAVGGELLITADHGNAECMFDHQTQQPHTAHTSEPVPFIYYGRKAHIINQHGSLRDIAPTILTLLGLPIPAVMTGANLLALDR